MRLIDADKFKQQIAAITIADNLSTEKCNAVCRLIDIQPTAYDVDKVIKRLEDKIEITWTCDYLGGRKDAFNEAIEIVKDGGVNE